MLKLAGYRETKQIYTGTRTFIYRGIRDTDGQSVIIKVLCKLYPNFNDLVQFRNQYVITRHLEHPGIVKPLALERYGNGYALVMLDEKAIALRDYWFQSKRNLREFLSIAIQLAKILHYLGQEHIIHKDIKPSNILINPKTHQVKLNDFCIATLLPKEQQRLESFNVLEGTLAYVSPEQTGRMNRGIDYRTDFYSLGVTLFELLNGKLPFETNDPMELVHCHIAKMALPLGNRELLTGNREEIPSVLSQIVMKLMAKNAEDRYQSALGLQHDLEQCLQQLTVRGKIASFPLGERDVCDRFLIPEKLYGREREVAQLLRAFQRVSQGEGEVGGQGGSLKASNSELLLVAGFSGIGKTAVINEVHKPIVKQRGYFIKGKFDQLNRNIPFLAFVQAFRNLMGQLLSESDADLANWQAKILEAVGENGQVIIDVIPELEKIIGKQPPVPKLSGSAAQNRFNLLFDKFVRVFATKDHPLVIFLDDLQWADSASLNLLKWLMNPSTGGYLLVLGAYRDNEVFPAHPLMLTLDEIQKRGATINTLTLTPLDKVDITCLVADTLLCSKEMAAPLSELVYQKTQGNPFFTNQFLQGLHEEGWIRFEVEAGYWQCDLTQVRQLALTDDVVAFMVGRLRKLPKATQKVLKLAACIGNRFDLGTLTVVSTRTADQVATDLWTGLQEGFVIPESQTYKFFQGDEWKQKNIEEVAVGYRFLHDRVQQAAYALIPDDQKQTTHYQIGQLLLQKIPLEARVERIFELVSQLNYGKALITEQTERNQLAQLNLIACSQAKAATAYQASREYASIGLSLLGENAWQRQYKMALAFHDNLAELASLCGDFEAMEQYIETVIAQTQSLLEQVNVYKIKILSNVTQHKLTKAIAIGLSFLQKLGVAFPETPTRKDVQESMAEIDELMRGRKIEDLVNLPVMKDREKITIIQIASSILPAAYFTGSLLQPLLVSLSVKLSIQYGNIEASAFCFAIYGSITCNFLQDVNTGIKFGQLALQLVSKLDAKAAVPEVSLMVGIIILHRTSHLKETLSLLQKSYRAALEVGNQEMAGNSAHNFCSFSFWCGQPLTTLEYETRNYCNGLVQFNQLTTANYCRIYWQSILNLLGVAEHPSLLSGEALQEAEFLPLLISAHDFYGLYIFYLYKLILCYLFTEIESAQSYAIEVRRYFRAGAGLASEAVFYLYDSLITLAAKTPDTESWQRVEQNQKQLRQHWAPYAPMNHQHKLDLVEAEQYRVQGQNYQAGDFYDRAIAGAKANGYIQEEALANELAAKFYLDWGKEKIAKVYLTDAYYCYAHWGAKAKTDQLEAKYPQLLTPIWQKQLVELNALKGIERLSKTLLSNTHTQTSSSRFSETLDLASLLQAAVALSSTIELNPLLREISRIILINAGAQKVVLLIPQAEQWQLRAMAQLTNDGTVETSTRSQPLNTNSPVSLRLVQYVKNSQEPVLINEAKTEKAGIIEGYLLENQPQSVLCLPLLERNNLVAILYLEHPTTKGVFTPYRQTIIRFLSSQAAIALQNAQLYEQAQQALQKLKETQLQLVKREKMSAFGNLVAGIGHEINNPISFLQGNIRPAQDYLQSLLGLIDLYQQKMPHPDQEIEEAIEAIDLEFIREDFSRLLESMKLGAERIRNISNSLRTFSRKDKEHKVNFNIHEGIDSTLIILKHRLKANEQRPRIQIIKDYGDIPEVQCFPSQLNQVFMNILANAIDAFEEANQGKACVEIDDNSNYIAVSTSLLGDDQVQFQIRDNGGGMSEETQKRIFEQGFTTKEIGKGTGLGMAITNQIITEKHGGTISCDSTPGQGTTLTITLPISG